MIGVNEKIGLAETLQEKIQSRKDGRPKPRENLDEEVMVWPELVFRELLAILAVVFAINIISILFNAPLEEIANPGKTPNPAKAPWYFVGLQELLVYFDPWIAGVVLPGIIILGLMAIPYLDPNPEGNSYYTFSQRKYTVTVFVFGFAMWFILIVIGQYLRGPSWQVYFPWEDWSVHKEPVAGLQSFSLTQGIAFLLTYSILGMGLPFLIAKDIYKKLGPAKYVAVMALLLMMIGVVVKIALRLLFNVKYILETPWFNI